MSKQDWVTIAAGFGKGFAFLGYMLLERWLGRTKTTQAASVLDLLLDVSHRVLDRFKQKGK